MTVQRAASAAPRPLRRWPRPRPRKGGGSPRDPGPQPASIAGGSCSWSALFVATLIFVFPFVWLSVPR